MAIDFNPLTQEYVAEVQRAIAFSGLPLEFFTKAKADHLIDLATRHVGEPKELTALDVGCGIGLTDRFLAGSFAALYGIDIAQDSLDEAARTNPQVFYQHYNGARFPFRDHGFDVVFAICVIQCVPVPERQALLWEMRRVTRPAGVVALFEHNPFNPLTRLAAARFGQSHDAPLLQRREALRLLLRTDVRLAEQRYILFCPSRMPLASTVERALRRLPLGAQYYVAGKKGSMNVRPSGDDDALMREHALATRAERQLIALTR